MGEGSFRLPLTSRPVLPLFILLASCICVLNCSQSPAAAIVGKIYPRGNHWAVGHLMGKKSLSELQEMNRDSDYLTPSDTELGQYEPLMKALMQQRNQKQKPQPADRLMHLDSSWRKENKYLKEVSDLLLLALRLRGNDST
ncbi:gastrin-releasing peptide [Solea solea]|uniref:gastrin-releasing peptide n=1 Tax=Solea solea TaxID=90069 RepID=UPI00272D09E0|nr:gastrin-releasing peptide [Solea solea]